MSLEQALQENTNVMRQLIEAITGSRGAGASKVFEAPYEGAGASAAPAPAAEVKPTDAKGAVAAAKAAAQKEAEDKAKTEAEAARVAAELEAKEAADLVGGAAEDTRVYDYQKDVAPLLNELLKKDKPALLALLAKYGAKNGAGIKAADYPKVVAELSI